MQQRFGMLPPWNYLPVQLDGHVRLGNAQVGEQLGNGAAGWHFTKFAIDVNRHR